MPAEEFAKNAMKDILGSSKGRVWHGSAVGLLKTLSGWAPQSLTVESTFPPTCMSIYSRSKFKGEANLKLLVPWLLLMGSALGAG